MYRFFQALEGPLAVHVCRHWSLVTRFESCYQRTTVPNTFLCSFNCMYHKRSSDKSWNYFVLVFYNRAPYKWFFQRNLKEKFKINFPQWCVKKRIVSQSVKLLRAHINIIYCTEDFITSETCKTTIHLFALQYTIITFYSYCTCTVQTSCSDLFLWYAVFDVGNAANRLPKLIDRMQKTHYSIKNVSCCVSKQQKGNKNLLK